MGTRIPALLAAIFLGTTGGAFLQPVAAAASSRTTVSDSGHGTSSVLRHSRLSPAPGSRARAAQAAPRTAPACTSSFGTVASPNAGTADNFLEGTAAVSATDVWAVGGMVDSGTGLDQTLTEHWDGNAWSIVTSPNQTISGSKTPNSLSGVAVVSASNVWAVGSFRNASSALQSLVMNWNGTSWTATALTQQGLGDNELMGVTTINSTDVWAVGYWSPTLTSTRQTLAWHWNGTTWSPTFPPNNSPGVFSSTLFGVSASGANDVFAVGRHVYGDNSYPIIEHWDGVNWTLTQPSQVNPYQILFGVKVVSSTLAWAVGFDDLDFSAPDQTMIYQWNGSTWTRVPSPNIGGSQHPNNELFAVTATSATDAWAVGAAFGPFNNQGQASTGKTLAAHWNGTSWSAVSSADASGANELNGVVAVSASNVWAVGDAFVGNRVQTLTENLCVAMPSVTGLNPSAGPLAGGNQVTITGTGLTTVSSVSFGSTPASSFTVNSDTSISATAPAGAGTVDVRVTNAAGQSPITAGDQYTYTPPPAVATISPNSGPEAGGTVVTITGANFTPDSSVSFGGFPAESVTVNSPTSISATAPAHCPGTVDVTVTTPGGTSPVTLADQYTFTGDLCAAVSTEQYHLTGSNGASWTDIDATRLSLTFTPNVDTQAILSGNADLWTSSAGYNQDLAISVNGTVAGWKESGGYAGIFSPNAAFVQTVVNLTAGQAYSIKLRWKANKPDAGTIWAGAGPIGGKYSPTSLIMMLVPATSANLSTRASTAQYTLANNDGNVWTDIDALNLSLPEFTPTASGTALINGNADLWTTRPGFNQDIGISVVDINMLPCTQGCQPAAWKESGGFAGTFSPNAAFVQTAYPMTAGHHYQIKLQWKANKPGGTIVAGAGPIGGQYSPTRLSLLFYPTGTPANPIDAVSTFQYDLTGNNGSSWADVDPDLLAITVSSANRCLSIFSGNADLWTSSSGFNQDIGISVNGTVVAWKESGGYAGTYSPNAAFVQIPYLLQANTSYDVRLVLKANKSDSGSIWVGAGPIGDNFSPTRLTVQLDGCS